LDAKSVQSSPLNRFGSSPYACWNAQRLVAVSLILSELELLRAATGVEEQMRAAFERAKLAGYDMNLMAPPPAIARAAEKVLDRLLELTELLGYPLRLSALEPRSEPHSRAEIRRILIAVSDDRQALIVLMQQDLGLRSNDESDIGARDDHRMLRS
jgi:hypothetical protein